MSKLHKIPAMEFLVKQSCMFRPATSLHDLCSYEGIVQVRSFKVTEKELYLSMRYSSLKL